jgi:hypothetical protein
VTVSPCAVRAFFNCGLPFPCPHCESCTWQCTIASHMFVYRPLLPILCLTVGVPCSRLRLLSVWPLALCRLRVLSVITRSTLFSGVVGLVVGRPVLMQLGSLGSFQFWAFRSPMCFLLCISVSGELGLWSDSMRQGNTIPVCIE